MKIFAIWKNGTWLVIVIVLLGIIAAGLTVRVYSQHVYSSHEAQVLNREGAIAAFYPQRFTKKILPHHIARITFQEQSFTLPCKAEVVSVNQTMLGRRHVLLVSLQILDSETSNEAAVSNLIPGAACSVTIDATIPRHLNSSEKN